MLGKEGLGVTPEDIDRARRITGIGAKPGTKVASEVPDDFVETLFDIVDKEQPALAYYLVTKYAMLEPTSRDENGDLIIEPGLSPTEDPFLSGVVFTYFSLPEEIRKKGQLSWDQAQPIERVFEESRAASENPALNLHQMTTRDFQLAGVLSDEVLSIANGLNTGQARFEFLAGSFLTLAPFVSMEDSRRLRALWEIDPNI